MIVCKELQVNSLNFFLFLIEYILVCSNSNQNKKKIKKLEREFERCVMEIDSMLAAHDADIAALVPTSRRASSILLLVDACDSKNLKKKKLFIDLNFLILYIFFD